MEKALITLNEVSHRFHKRWILRGLTLCLSEQRIGVIGANGSGKSTFARLLNGLVLPSAGRVMVNGWDTARDTRAVRRQVGFCFSNPELQILMPTVAEDVSFSIRKSNLTLSQRDARVAETLSQVGLSEMADHPSHSLSGGEKQLLSLAAVLVTEPAVLVCDEPTTLLDLRYTTRVTEILHGYPRQLVVATHDLGILTGFDRVIALDKGEVDADGEPDEVVHYYRRRIR